MKSAQPENVGIFGLSISIREEIFVGHLDERDELSSADCNNITLLVPVFSQTPPAPALLTPGRGGVKVITAFFTVLLTHTGQRAIRATSDRGYADGQRIYTLHPSVI